MKLFEKYCAPSVQAQTSKDFDWYIIVDPSFPGLTKNHLSTLSGYGTVLHCDSYWNEKCPEIAFAETRDGDELCDLYLDQWVCSTRLDSDDMLEIDFFQRLKGLATEKEQFISFPHGVIIKDGWAANRRYLQNPFISYIEYNDKGSMKTVFSVDHTKCDKAGVPLVEADDRAAWAQVDHGDNIKNSATRKVRNFDSNKYMSAILGSRFIWRHDG